MKIRYPAAALLPLAVVAFATAQTTRTNGAAKPSESPAHATVDRATGAQLLQEVTALQQLDALRLTSGQHSDIEQRLLHLQQTYTAYGQREDKAARTVNAQLGRIRAALIADKAPSAADQQQVRAALAPTRSDDLAYTQLRQATVDAIRQDLSRDQLDLIRVNLGMAPVGQADWGPLLAGPTPGGEWYPPEMTGFPAQGMGVNPDALLAVMDTARTLPALEWTRRRGDLANQAAAALGAVPGTPYFAITYANMNALLDEVRGVDVTEYQANRQPLAMNLAWQAYYTQNAASARNTDQAIAASIASDEEAVSRFFLRDEVLRALRLRLAK